MEANVEVALTTDKFESGAARVKRESSEMARASRASSEEMGSSLQKVEKAGVEAGARAGGGIRGIGHALRATTGEAGALHFGLTEIAKAAGLGTASIIALGAGAEAVQKVATSFAEASARSREMGEQVARVFSGGGGTGTGSSSGLRRQIDEASAAIDKLTPGKESVIDIGARAAQNAYRAATGNPSVEEETDQRIAALDALRTSNSLELAKRRKEEVDFSIRGLTVGEENLRVEKAQLETRERIRAITDDPAVAGQAAAQMIDAEKALGAARVKAAEEETQRVSDVYALRKKIAEINTPGITTGKLGFNPEDLQRFAQVKSVATANAEFSQALSDLQTAKNAGHDTSAADAAATDKQRALSDEIQRLKDRGALMDVQTKVLEYQENGQRVLAAYTLKDYQNRQLVTQELRAGNVEFAAQLKAQQDIASVAERAAAFRESQNHALQTEAAQRAARDEVDAARLNDNGLTHNASRDGSLIHDANGPGGSSIPDAGQTGGSAAHERDLIGDNASIPNLPGIANFKGTANMFDRTSANRALGNAHSAREALEQDRGDFEHDLAARMAAAPNFRSEAGMEWDLKGAGVKHFSQGAIERGQRAAADKAREKWRSNDPRHSSMMGQSWDPSDGSGAAHSRMMGRSWDPHDTSRKGVAEENRPREAQKQQKEDHGVPQMVGAVNKLVGQLQGIASKLGSA